MRAAASIAASLAVWIATTRPVAAQIWVQQGPSPTTGGQVEGISGGHVSGSVNAILAHPTNADVFIIGATNGGLWTTSNASGGNPTWTARSQQLPSLSIGALAWDMNDASFNTIWAGTARNSSFGEGGRRSGVYRSTDGGATWSTVGGNGTLAGQDIVGLVARGNTVVTAARGSDANTFGTIGIFRSTNGGATFSQVGGNLPQGRVYDLQGDPTNVNRLYTAVTATSGNANIGFYRSIDIGATWTLVSPAAMNTQIQAASNAGNVKIAVGNAGNVYCSIISQTTGQLSGMWYSTNAGSSWVQLASLPTTDSGAGVNPGGQGRLHTSIVADPNNPNIVYVGGDRQPRSNNDAGGFPNQIGASNFTGRLFKGTITNSLTGAVTWQAITHNPDGDGTNVGAPHADSRRMVFDALGRLIEVDDGGIYRRNNPTNVNGTWVSLNNNLQVAEVHSARYDRKTNTLIAGTQDTGTIEQASAGSATWRTVNQGDGGRVAVDNADVGANSIRYTSSQFYGGGTNGLRRRTYNSSNVQQSNTGVALIVAGSGGQNLYANDANIQFYGPLETNKVVGGRLYVGTRRVYESLDSGANITAINSSLGTPDLGASVTTIVAGGRLSGVNNPDVLYAGTTNSRVFLRTTAGGILNQLTSYTGASVQDIVMNTQNWQEVYVIDNNQVFRSINAGTAFTDVTGNLPNVGTMELQTVEYVDLPAAAVDDVILVGGRDGIFAARTSNPFFWFELGGSSMPNVPVFDLQYDAEDNILMAGTLGRGLFTLANFSSFFQPVPEPSTYACIGAAAGCFFLFRRRKAA
jgi:hypothetical protein